MKSRIRFKINQDSRVEKYLQDKRIKKNDIDDIDDIKCVF
ncbi:955_t:CDS:2 [Racocetra fulgida]|uniref:955_t:CDS:1 n=1 Tax=Racocetra fulgida TaxID=60492 RepID=A0A9N8Z011_9GLOM|nr:955_t:CDS:2 [Racocetra fulgida]